MPSADATIRSTTAVPISHLVDTLMDGPGELGDLERRRAASLLTFYMRNSKEAASYELGVYLLGQRGQMNAARHLINEMGPTHGVLPLRSAGLGPVLSHNLAWPGKIECNTDLIVDHAIIGGGHVDGVVKYGRLELAGEVIALELQAFAGVPPERLACMPNERGEYHIDELLANDSGVMSYGEMYGQTSQKYLAATHSLTLNQ